MAQLDRVTGVLGAGTFSEMIQKLFDASEGRSGIRRQAALCALDLLMP